MPPFAPSQSVQVFILSSSFSRLITEACFLFRPTPATLDLTAIITRFPCSLDAISAIKYIYIYIDFNFIWKRQEDRHGFHLLLHSSNSCKPQGWMRLKLDPSRAWQGPQVSDTNHHLLQRALQRSWSRQRSGNMNLGTLTWDLDIPGIFKQLCQKLFPSHTLEQLSYPN